MRKKELRMKVSYEPNRLTEKYLANAYENIMPIIKHLPNDAQKKADTPTLKIFHTGRR